MTGTLIVFALGWWAGKKLGKANPDPPDRAAESSPARPAASARGAARKARVNTESERTAPGRAR